MPAFARGLEVGNDLGVRSIDGLGIYFLGRYPFPAAITYTTVRANLASAMDRVCNDHEALIITRNGEQSVVMLSLEDFKALEETAYLLRTPANAKRLLSAVAQLNAGKGVERKLTK